MNSKKSMLLIVALAVLLGGIVFSGRHIACNYLYPWCFGLPLLLLTFQAPTQNQIQNLKFPTKTLYVGNSFHKGKANESHVRELFSEHGGSTLNERQANW